ncbi:hypothetical protein PanWU01x14_031430 [Parasponia andersonii]|uniref:Uncharacterized protein n=1 Tax=Parasponia andersonii TaxID=3476 RepID=A0A2P5DU54_PARAD|nr:hypothetical protein PanWU01x14_031430 [Parasponia andersonii]
MHMNRDEPSPLTMVRRIFVISVLNPLQSTLSKMQSWRWESWPAMVTMLMLKWVVLSGPRSSNDVRESIFRERVQRSSNDVSAVGILLVRVCGTLMVKRSLDNINGEKEW